MHALHRIHNRGRVWIRGHDIRIPGLTSLREETDMVIIRAKCSASYLLFGVLMYIPTYVVREQHGASFRSRVDVGEKIDRRGLEYCTHVRHTKGGGSVSLLRRVLELPRTGSRRRSGDSPPRVSYPQPASCRLRPRLQSSWHASPYLRFISPPPTPAAGRVTSTFSPQAAPVTSFASSSSCTPQR
jgi:hypothetical protein